MRWYPEHIASTASITVLWSFFVCSRTCNAAANAAITEGRFAQTLTQEGATPGNLPPEGGDRFVLADIARWREVAQAANIRVE